MQDGPRALHWDCNVAPTVLLKHVEVGCMSFARTRNIERSSCSCRTVVFAWALSGLPYRHCWGSVYIP